MEIIKLTDFAQYFKLIFEVFIEIFHHFPCIYIFFSSHIFSIYYIMFSGGVSIFRPTLLLENEW